MATKKVRVKLRSYSDVENNYTRIVNSMHEYIPDPYTFSVYFYLCKNFNSKKGYAFPSIRNISDHCHFSEKKVRNCVKWLVENKYISKKQVNYGSGYKNNIYFIRYLDIEDIIEEVVNLQEEIDDAYIEIEIEIKEKIEDEMFVEDVIET